MQATRLYRRASAARVRDAAGGTRAASARSTIGARVPSMSQRIAACSGASVSARSDSASPSAVGAATRRSMPARMSSRVLRLALVGCLAGAFSGLFGVGGGSVIVPLLVLWLGFGEREATGTSLAAIVIIATLAAWRQRGYGNVRLRDGMWIGVLSLPGVALGTALANALSERTLKLFFAALLIVLAIGLARRALRRVDD